MGSCTWQRTTENRTLCENIHYSSNGPMQSPSELYPVPTVSNSPPLWWKNRSNLWDFLTCPQWQPKERYLPTLAPKKAQPRSPWLTEGRKSPCLISVRSKVFDQTSNLCSFKCSGSQVHNSSTSCIPNYLDCSHRSLTSGTNSKSH